MSIRQLKTRLDRLEKEVKGEERKIPFNFALDPALVKAMSDDYDRLDALDFARVEYWRGPLHPDYPIPDTPEIRALRERIAETAKTISCPPSYGFREFWIDNDRGPEYLFELEEEEEKVQIAEVKVRMEAFKQSPEGRARIRLHELENGPGLRTAAEREEID